LYIGDELLEEGIVTYYVRASMHCVVNGGLDLDVGLYLSFPSDGRHVLGGWRDEMLLTIDGPWIVNEHPIELARERDKHPFTSGPSGGVNFVVTFKNNWTPSGINLVSASNTTSSKD
jgi:hypothetical protein